MYWAITTMMTLGSQYQPTTTGSEIVELLLLIAGVGFISLLTGALAKQFTSHTKAKADAPAESGSDPTGN